MDKSERNWFIFLILVFLVFNILTFSPLVPWQKWTLWEHPSPDQVVQVDFGNYEIHMDSPVEVNAGEYIEFRASSSDVTYGLGVFRKDMSMVFQMQVVPGENNRILWMFDESGWFDVRSTEYSGPRHSEMFLPDAIHVN
jgi:cytochrome c oxidase subunit 2